MQHHRLGMQLSAMRAIRKNSEVGFYRRLELQPDLARDGILLKRAVYHGRHDMIVKLLRCGADVNFDNDYAIKTAVKANDKALTLLLLEYGADVDTGRGCLLTQAVRIGSTKMIRILLESGLDMSANNYQAFRKAVELANAPLVKLFLQSELRVDVRANSDAAILTAVKQGSIEIYRMLVEAYTIPEIAYQLTIESAIVYRQTSIAGIAIAALGQHWIMLHTALKCSIANHAYEIYLLIRQTLGKANTNFKVNSTIRSAIKCNYLPVICDIDILYPDLLQDNSASYLELAINHNSVDIVRYFHNKKYTTNIHHELLIKTCRNDHLDMMACLLQMGADISLMDSVDLVSELAANSQFDMLQILIHHGLRVHQTNGFVLDCALEMENFRMVNYLFRHKTSLGDYSARRILDATLSHYYKLMRSFRRNIGLQRLAAKTIASTYGNLDFVPPALQKLVKKYRFKAKN